MKTLNIIFRFLGIAVFVFILLATGAITSRYFSNDKKTITPQNILGIFFPSPTNTPTPTIPSPTPTITPIPYFVKFESLTKDMEEGGVATFTWSVEGGSAVIHKTTVYFGTSSMTKDFDKNTIPADTKYTESVKDFLDGDYNIPLRFIGNAAISKQGTYYVRAYALIDGLNFWSDERTFRVNPLPKNTIKIINYPEKVKPGENAAFTWEVMGPAGTTSFTAIVGGKESKSGSLDETMPLTLTPYTVLVKDFITGTQNVPLRYIGNSILSDKGTYYFRALAYINGKNIWSEERTITVE